MAADHYQTLEISRTASPDEIRRAYLRLVRTHHPDHNVGDPQAITRFKRIQVAFEVLSNPQLRRRYNIQLQRLEHPPVRRFEGPSIPNSKLSSAAVSASAAPAKGWLAPSWRLLGTSIAALIVFGVVVQVAVRVHWRVLPGRFDASPTSSSPTLGSGTFAGLGDASGLPNDNTTVKNQLSAPVPVKSPAPLGDLSFAFSTSDELAPLIGGTQAPTVFFTAPQSYFGSDVASSHVESGEWESPGAESPAAESDSPVRSSATINFLDVGVDDPAYAALHAPLDSRDLFAKVRAEIEKDRRREEGMRAGYGNIFDQESDNSDSAATFEITSTNGMGDQMWLDAASPTTSTDLFENSWRAGRLTGFESPTSSLSLPSLQVDVGITESRTSRALFFEVPTNRAQIDISLPPVSRVEIPSPVRELPSHSYDQRTFLSNSASSTTLSSDNGMSPIATSPSFPPNSRSSSLNSVDLQAAEFSDEPRRLNSSNAIVPPRSARSSRSLASTPLSSSPITSTPMIAGPPPTPSKSLGRLPSVPVSETSLGRINNVGRAATPFSPTAGPLSSVRGMDSRPFTSGPPIGNGAGFATGPSFARGGNVTAGFEAASDDRGIRQIGRSTQTAVSGDYQASFISPMQELTSNIEQRRYGPKSGSPRAVGSTFDGRGYATPPSRSFVSPFDASRRARNKPLTREEEWTEYETFFDQP
ncbi:MAG: DnaJ domain-containing protein [Planctomycetales bacterium]|nr:DnaJ domain-containing protein [Planctomycetales bacterium]